jgi:hypothetical protein
MTSMVVKMQRWIPPLSTKPTQRWQSREEILKEYWDSLSPAEPLRVNPTLYALRRAVEYRRKYDPDQPRVPAGNSDGGQWTSDGSSDARQQLANIIRVCIISGVSRTTDMYGNKTWMATYDCAGNRSFVRTGPGHSPPGLVLDPFR